MNQINKICHLPGHEDFQIEYLCLFPKCDQKTRWNCSECLKQQIHRHDLDNFQFLMQRKEVCLKILEDIQKYNNNQYKYLNGRLNNILEIITKLEKQIKDYRNYIETLFNSYLTDNKQQLIQLLKECENDSFYFLDDQKINTILNHQLFITDIQQEQNSQLLQNIKSLITELESYIKNETKVNIDERDLGKIQYQMQQIDQTLSTEYYYGCQISQNEQYLAYGGSENKLIVYNLQTGQKIKEIKLKGYCMSLTFSNDSKQLLLAVGQGDVLQYDILDNFRLIKQFKIHGGNIFKILLLCDEQIITCSNDQYIIKTNLKNKKQMFKLKGTSFILTIEYLEEQNILISGSSDQSIQFWDCNDQSFTINKQNAHNNQITQIQVIKNQQQLLSLCHSGQLYLWKIDLSNKDIIKIQEFQDSNRIFNFYSVNNQQSIVIICEKYVKIFDRDGKTINQINHEAGSNQINYDCKQLDSLNYILIRSQNKIVIARKKQVQEQLI